VQRIAVVSCPEFSGDLRAFEPVVAAVESLAPAVEVLHPGACAFAARGPARYFGGEESMARAIAEAAARAGATACSIGIADGHFAAEIAARDATIVAPGRTREFLAAQPVRMLADDELATNLLRLGLRTLGDFAALPDSAVADRFGESGARAHRRARGEEDRTLAPRALPPDLAVRMEFDPPAELSEQLAFAARALATDLDERLASHGLACSRVLIEAQTVTGDDFARRWRYEGGFTPDVLADRARLQLESWRARTAASLDDGVVFLRLTPEQTFRDRGRQAAFFGRQAERERVARALARVQGICGDDSVQIATITGGRAPADRISLRAWGEQDSSPAKTMRKPNEVPPWPGALPSPSPATVYAEPRPARLTDARGADVRVDARGTTSAPPARLTIGGATARVVAWAGPWLLVQRWWNRRASRREACWQVLTERGDAYLLALRAGRFWIDAVYD
jgi:protein ImuB